MHAPRKPLLRLAVAIHKQLTSPANNPAPVELPTSSWQELQRLARLIGLARQHNWHLAAVRLISELASRLDVLRGETAELAERLTASEPSPSRFSLLDVYRDLVALHDEFPTAEWNIRQKTLSVTTEAIVLDGIDLGPFEICLDWRHLKDSDSYRVVAQEPNPASNNSSVTHPHVLDEELCEGEARVPIRKALADGRLADFFLIVVNVLRTYNDNSPYVALDRWYGAECSDCGTSVCDDEGYTCEKCETTVCGECNFNCPGCDGIFCNECVTRCEGCDENHCSGCMKLCSRCHAETCQSCLDKHERCKTCHENTTASQHEASRCAGTETTVAIG